MLKILTVIGARPQFIKASAVSREIAKDAGLQEIILHTGQHHDDNMSQVFFEQMDIPHPLYHLGIHGLRHGAMTGQMLQGIEEVLLREKPGWVMVYGDTDSTLAGALAAVKQHIPVAHVEAGLRSFNNRMPEEWNRILTDRVSNLLCCPTAAAAANLQREGFGHFPCRIEMTGDVMYDAALYFSAKSIPPAGLHIEGDYLLATIHRAENTDDPHRLKQLMHALQLLSDKFPVVLPLHPRTSKRLDSLGMLPLPASILNPGPLGYLEMLHLLKHCHMVLTDSGGLQKEAYFFDKNCITLRGETEWTELVEAGCNKVCGTQPARILKAFEHFSGQTAQAPKGLYGDGRAAAHVVSALKKGGQA